MLGIRDAAIRAGLLFPETEREARFRSEFARSALPLQRTVITLAIAINLVFSASDLMIDPALGYPALYVRLFGIIPVLGIMLRLSYTEPAQGPHHQLYATASFLVVVVLLGFMSHLRIPAEGVDPQWPYKTMTWMLIVFAITAVSGLLLAGAAIVGLAGSLAWLIILIATRAPAEFRIFQILFIFACFLFGCTAAYWLERRARLTFAAQEALAGEKARVERMLQENLPEDAAARVASGQHPVADAYVEATVIFADVSGFTALSKRIGAAETVRILDKLFTAFDAIVSAHGLEKVKIVGDGYIAIARPRPGQTALSADAVMAVRCAVAMTEEAARIAAAGRHPIALRCGLHLGPVIGGVIGRQRPAYDFWGDALNVASRLQDCAESGEVLCSESVYWRVEGTFPFEPRGECQLHGYGPMRAYLVRAGGAA